MKSRYFPQPLMYIIIFAVLVLIAIIIGVENPPFATDIGPTQTPTVVNPTLTPAITPWVSVPTQTVMLVYDEPMGIFVRGTVRALNSHYSPVNRGIVSVWKGTRLVGAGSVDGHGNFSFRLPVLPLGYNSLQGIYNDVRNPSTPQSYETSKSGIDTIDVQFPL